MLQFKATTWRNDVAEAALWRETFSGRELLLGKPGLRWPGDPTERHVAKMNAGLLLARACS